MRKIEFDWNKNLSSSPVAHRKTSTEEIRNRVHERINKKATPYFRMMAITGALVMFGALVILSPLNERLIALLSNRMVKPDFHNEKTTINNENTDVTGKYTLNPNEVLPYPVIKENLIQFDTPGPIQHMVWKRPGFTDEWWQNTVTGESKRISSDIDRGIVETSITEVEGNNCFLYRIVTQKGRLELAEKIPQLNNDGKSHWIIDDKKITDTAGYTLVKEYEIAGRHVSVMEKGGTRYFVDKATMLPVVVQSMNLNNGKSEEQIFMYSFLQKDDFLFKAPKGIVYHLMPAIDATLGK